MTWQWCHFLLAFNTSGARDRVYQIVLNRKNQVSSMPNYVKAKLCKKKSCKMRPACTYRKKGVLENENHQYIATWHGHARVLLLPPKTLKWPSGCSETKQLGSPILQHNAPVPLEFLTKHNMPSPPNTCLLYGGFYFPTATNIKNATMF